VNTARGALAAELAGNEDVNMSDVAFTLAGRPKDTTRMAAVVHDRQHAVKVLQEAEHENIFIGEAAAVESPSERVVFAFPGQGAQHAGMARGLYDTEPVFAEHFDRCAASFLDELGVDLRTEVFDGAGPGLERTDRAQPALFTVEYALAKLIESYGVHAAALCGHSIGEFVAAALAGVFDLETAISAVSLRARLMHASPAGAMIAVPLGPAEIAEHLPPDVDVSAINDHGSCVVAGTKEGIRAFTNKLSGQGITVRRVRTAHGFHSRSMDDVVPEFEGFLSGLAFRKPDIPLLSNVTGSWLTDAEATDPGMWARQVRQTVRFADEVDAMLAHPSRVLVEVGPGGSLTASAVRHPRWSNGHRAVRLMRHPTQNRDDRDVFLLGLGQLWAADIDVDWTRLSSGSRPRVVSLSSYPSAHEENSVGPTRAGHLTRTEPPELDQSHIEAALQGIVAECLGLSSVDVNADFFDIGTDSLIAAGVALRAANEGLDVTPQDLYEHPTVARLAKAVAGRYLAGGLTHKPPTDEVNPPVPPNIAHFLERGLEEPGRWRVPMILRLDPRIGPDDVRSVLTALANTHDALRLQIVERAGTWEQQIAPPQEFAQLSVRPLAGEIVGDSGRERAAIIDILGEIMAEQGLANTPLAAVYVAGPHGDSRYLGITLHETACDNAAREILVADLFTAFAQRMAGQEIVLQPTTTTWREWSHRCAELAGHPAVIASRQYWLANSTSATLRLADDRADGRPHAGDMTRLSSALTTDQTAEVDDARRRTKRTMDATLLGALSRTIAHVIGEGVVAVDLEGAGRSVLKPDVDLRRTVGWFTTIYPVPLTCTTEAGATELLETINETLAAVPHYGIGYGLLRYMFAPTARHLAAARPPDIHFSYLGTIPVPPAGVGPIEFDSEVDMPVRETIPGLGHAVELRVYRVSGALRFDWWYDTRRVERATAEALAQHFPVALAELTRQASESTSMDHEADGAVTALSLVDLSATDTG
jgi:phthiocerol/phenolphthiocerol synthesis type-I polyketide synthase E